eukprot:CAMPEP_0202696104 /NCGR_PEP_ID=MMETSP1385-20130828/9455_1 /ASSEMBLY_ACC=CAM_ASM_000861 /TAXON_ID=933848 /ORGANISM="Elphidium margaritaceum" /LENGTH=634 /DNA_ID=CAMNT_0049352215 /DNA_START=92 /DNA_END=1996 /DNA_ORIENTATION=-
MKQILGSFLAAYTLTSGQAPPAVLQNPFATTGAVAAETTTTTSAPAQTTTAAPAQTTTTGAPAQTTGAAAQTTTTSAAAQTTELQNPFGSTVVVPAQTTTGAPAQTTTTATPAQTTTSAPVQTTTSAPAQTTTTSAPQTTTTAAPSTTSNMHCPAGAGLGLPSGAGSMDQACLAGQGIYAVATDWQGRIRCNDFSCCHCLQVNCGFQGYPCEQAQFGDSGVVGVQSININGAGNGWVSGNSGAELECQGLESCKATKISANYIWKGECSGDFGCQEAVITVANPAPNMIWQCNGLMACLGMELQIVVGDPSLQCPEGQVGSGIPTIIETIEFNGQQSAQNAKVSIFNYGCDPVVIKNLECMGMTSCPNTQFSVVGNVVVESCDLRGLQNLNALPAALQQCVSGGLPIQLQPLPITPVLPTQLPPVVQTLPPVQPSSTLATVAPVSTSSTTATSSTVAPVTPAVTAGAPTLLVLPPGSNKVLNCNGVAAVCTGQTIAITPENNFVLDCSSLSGCAGTTLNLNVGLDPHTQLPVDRIDSLKFVGYNSGSGATVYLNNVLVQNGNPLARMVKLDNVRCENPGSCNNLQIIAGVGIDVTSTNLDCSGDHSCVGCTVTQGAVTASCDPTAVATQWNQWA